MWLGIWVGWFLSGSCWKVRLSRSCWCPQEYTSRAQQQTAGPGGGWWKTPGRRIPELCHQRIWTQSTTSYNTYIARLMHFSQESLHSTCSNCNFRNRNPKLNQENKPHRVCEADVVIEEGNYCCCYRYTLLLEVLTSIMIISIILFLSSVHFFSCCRFL